MAKKQRVRELLALRPDGLDRRTAAFREFASIRNAVLGDCGGIDAITETRKQLIDRFVLISLWCASQDARALAGAEIDMDVYSRVSSHLRRIAEGVGMTRTARDVLPSLAEYLKSKPPEDSSQ